MQSKQPSTYQITTNLLGGTEPTRNKEVVMSLTKSINKELAVQSALAQMLDQSAQDERLLNRNQLTMLQRLQHAMANPKLDENILKTILKYFQKYKEFRKQQEAKSCDEFFLIDLLFEDPEPSNVAEYDPAALLAKHLQELIKKPNPQSTSVDDLKLQIQTRLSDIWQKIPPNVKVHLTTQQIETIKKCITAWVIPPNAQVLAQITPPLQSQEEPENGATKPMGMM